MVHHPPPSRPSTVSPFFQAALSSAACPARLPRHRISIGGRGLFSGISSPSQSDGGDSRHVPPDPSEWPGHGSISQRDSPSSPGENKEREDRAVATSDAWKHARDALDQVERGQQPTTLKADNHQSNAPVPLFMPLSWRQAAGLNHIQSLGGGGGYPGPSESEAPGSRELHHHAVQPKTPQVSSSDMDLQPLLSHQRRLLQAYNQHLCVIEAEHVQSPPWHSRLGGASSRPQPPGLSTPGTGGTSSFLTCDTPPVIASNDLYPHAGSRRSLTR